MTKKLLGIIIFLLTISTVYQMNLSLSKVRSDTKLYEGRTRPCVGIHGKYMAFFTWKDDPKTESIVNCVDIEKNAVMWKKTFAGSKIRDIKNTGKFVIVEYDNDYFVPDKETVIDTYFICYNLFDGKKLWENKYTSISEKMSVVSYPSAFIINGDNLYFHFNKKYYCLDLSTGKENFTIDSECFLSTPKEQYEDLVFFVEEHPTYSLICIRKDKVLWRTSRDAFIPPSLCKWNNDWYDVGFGKIIFTGPKFYLIDGFLSFIGFNIADEKYYVFNLNSNDGSVISKIPLPDEKWLFYFQTFFQYKQYFLITAFHGSWIKCIDSQGKKLWETTDDNDEEERLTLIGFYKDFALVIGVSNKNVNTIKGLRLRDGKEVKHNGADFKHIDNAFLEGSEIFIFSEGKLQKIDLSQIDFTTKLKFNPTQGTYTQNGTSYELDTPLEITNNRVFISASNIFEPLCGKNEFENKEGIIKATLDDKTIELQINNHVAKINGTEKQIDPNNPKIMPYINKEGYIMVPIRFITESFGCKIIFDPDTKEIIVTYQP